MTLAQPAWLILLVLLPLLGLGAVLVARLRRQQWSALVAPRLRPTLIKRSSPIPRWFALFFLLVACATIIAALSRPQGDAGIRNEKSKGRNLMIALDLSRSMRTRDVKPDRLAQAKLVIYELLDAMPDERIGLIGFAGNAYSYAPLTIDHRAVRETVEQIDETWAPLGGSNLADAVRLAVDTLKKTGQKNNALVILSDGEKNEGDLDSMISEAERSGVYILAVGVGTEDGDYVPNADAPDHRMVDQNGKPVISRLQADVMRKLAKETKGRFAVAGSGMNIPAMVKSVIQDLDTFEMEGRERKISIEFYQWLVFPAIIFLMAAILAGSRWRGISTALVTAGIFLTPNVTRADAITNASDALKNKHYTEAKEAYHKLADETPLVERKARFQLGEATAAYRGGDFKQARSAYSGAMLSDDPEVLATAHLGMANSLFQLGWRGLTDESYPTDSNAVPDLTKFDALVKDRLAKLKEAADPESDTSRGYVRIESLVTDWTDAVRHFDASLDASSGSAARHNRDMTMIYLNRLAELLKEDQQQTEQSMPQPGEGDPQQGEGNPKEKDQQNKPGDNGDNGPKQPGKQGNNDPPKPNNSGDNKSKPKDGSDQKQGESDANKPSQNPSEKPEERARRILKENADLEKGPLTPGRREFLKPAKDW